MGGRKRICPVAILKDPGLTWSDLWKSKSVKHMLKVVVVAAAAAHSSARLACDHPSFATTVSVTIEVIFDD